MPRKSYNSKKRQGEDNIVFIADGECESWYIQLLKRNEPQVKIKITPSLPKPGTLVDCFETAKKLSKFYTVVFWIVDFDAIMKETREAPAGKETALNEFKRYYNYLMEDYDNVKIIINNPCLEYWYLLHYKNTNKTYKDYNSMKTDLRKFIPGYDKTYDFYFQANDMYKRLKPCLNTAVTNSKKIKEIDLDNLCGVSQMHKLFDAEIESSKIIDMLSSYK